MLFLCCVCLFFCIIDKHPNSKMSGVEFFVYTDREGVIREFRLSGLYKRLAPGSVYNVHLSCRGGMYM